MIRFKSLMLQTHQQGHYLDGLRKLGIAGDPPAVAAAKYHYLSNTIGGMNLQYIEETPKKVWIRYVHPDEWNSGSGMVALPASVQRATFMAWHARNAQKMQCPRLGYVCTKVWEDGEPYNEGYFIEYDHDISPDETVAFRQTSRTPPFDPGAVPVLDPTEWPLERVLRARQKYAAGYVSTNVEALLNRYGVETACHIVAQTCAMVAVQNHEDLTARLGVAGSDLGTVAQLLMKLAEGEGEAPVLLEDGPLTRTVLLRAHRLFDPVAGGRVRDALFALPRMLVRLTSGTIRAERIEEMQGDRRLEGWRLVETGQWLY